LISQSAKFEDRNESPEDAYIEREFSYNESSILWKGAVNEQHTHNQIEVNCT
jgi:hypothetical protein